MIRKLPKHCIIDKMLKKTNSEIYRSVRDKMIVSSAANLTIFKFFGRSET